MKIKNLNFDGFVFGQAGVQGFFGGPDEHKIHKILRILFRGFSFSGMIFVAKTVTLEKRIYPNLSNTELRFDGYKLKRLFPKSIWISPWSFLMGYMMNAMGIPNPGILRMLLYGKWQRRRDTFQISIALMGKTLKEKIIEVEKICAYLSKHLSLHKHHYAVQLNDSCPNIGHDQKQDSSEMVTLLRIFKNKMPGLVIIVKYDFTVTPETILTVKPYCDAFCIGNSLGFGKLKDEEWWKKLFRSGKSPLLEHFGGEFAGGLSGAPLFPILIEWLEKMEKIDDSVIIIAGGGIMKKEDILLLSHFKIVHAPALGSVASLRPWRLRSLIKYGNQIFELRSFTI